ncbi:hypothetical protein TYRP_002498 [Tyrophagus putrescentiae]|nr:hypothetical protein TYRP_002498 [Tyrophagus putrescentiae]
MVLALTIALFVAITVEARPYSNNGGFRARAAPAAPSYSDDSSYSATAGNRRARQAEPEPKPEPYSFTYETTDEYGTTLTRTESGDEQGNVKGSYMYRDPEGIYRTVEYADNGDGFSANVQSNEPGVVSHKPADAEYLKN